MNDPWPIDYVQPSERTSPTNLYAMKHRVMQIEICRRWIPEHLKWVFDELVKQ